MAPRIAPRASLIAGLGTLSCILLAIAALILTRIASQMIGAPSIFTFSSVDQLAGMRGVWGLYLAAEIVKEVLAAAFAATIWAGYLALPATTRLREVALAIGTIGGILLWLGFRFSINAVEKLAEAGAPYDGSASQTLVGAGLACAGASMALSAIEGHRAGIHPRWVRDAGLVLALLGIASLVYEPAIIGFAVIAIAWWAGTLGALFGSPRATAR